MSFRTKVLKLIESEWKCFGKYGYGDGAVMREARRAGRPISAGVLCHPQLGECPRKQTCLAAHVKAADAANPDVEDVAKTIEDFALDNRLDEDSAAQMLRVRLFEKLGDKFTFVPPEGSAARRRIGTHYEKGYADNHDEGLKAG
ncbi:MAG: hypothetical protein Q7S02_06440 [bacterium]|nr:hypothetical protein [bacterium]